MTSSMNPRIRPPFTVHPRRPGDPAPALDGFVLIHRALRSGSRLIAKTCVAIGAGQPCSPEQHAALAWFAEHVLYEIHAHHEKEDDVLWPVIEASAAGRVDLSSLSEDHRELAALLQRTDDLLARFRVDVGASADLGDVMADVADELDEHIADEEATVFPIMREHVSAADFARCEKLFQKGASLRHVAFLLPWVVAQCTPAERAALMPKAPLPVRVILRLHERRWTRRVAVIVG